MRTNMRFKNKVCWKNYDKLACKEVFRLVPLLLKVLDSRYIGTAFFVCY